MRFISRSLPALLSMALWIGLSAAVAIGAPKTEKDPMQLWYDKPATAWMTEALPIGNGRFGAMIFGGTEQERIQFNEDSLWSGDANPSGDFDTMGAYEAFGDIHLDLKNQAGTTHYRRDLNISDATAHVSYQVGGYVYEREYFCSFPDQVMAVRLTTSSPDGYSGTLTLSDMHSGAISVSGSLLTSSGALHNGLKYEAQLLVQHDGGTVAGADGKIMFEHCRSLRLLLACGTNYIMDPNRGWFGEAPHDRVSKQLTAAAVHTYAQLRTAHVRDYQKLFDRLHIDLGATEAKVRALPTDARLKAYAAGTPDPALEALFFQYGRYLTIASSRPGSLPINLQGLWNDRNDPPWHSDYHTDINIQMCYWPTEPANLSECTQPLLDLLKSQLPEWRKATQADSLWKLDSGPVRGWNVRTSHNIYGGMGWKWINGVNAWYVQNLWEHYAFTGDKAYLRDYLYPILKEETQFWQDHLKSLPEGSLVVPHGWSPEHGPENEDGVSFDQELVWDLFTNYLDASRILDTDAGYRTTVAGLREKLMVPKIGHWGQLQEWMVDRDDMHDDHRHVSHLVGLYPGRQISPESTPALAAAARVSLTSRGDGGTGWSRANKIGLWARLLDGDHAYTLLRNQLKLVGSTGTDMDNGGGTYPNMLDAHPPFQIDGNFGATSGICEMLAQSHTGIIHLLPALPKSWPTGKVTGLCARTGFVLHITWASGTLQSALVQSAAGQTLRLANPFAACRIYRNGRLRGVSRERVLTIETHAGDTFRFIGAQ